MQPKAEIRTTETNKCFHTGLKPHQVQQTFQPQMNTLPLNKVHYLSLSNLTAHRLLNSSLLMSSGVSAGGKGAWSIDEPLVLSWGEGTVDP